VEGECWSKIRLWVGVGGGLGGGFSNGEEEVHARWGWEGGATQGDGDAAQSSGRQKGGGMEVKKDKANGERTHRQE